MRRVTLKRVIARPFALGLAVAVMGACGGDPAPEAEPPAAPAPGQDAAAADDAAEPASAAAPDPASVAAAPPPPEARPAAPGAPAFAVIYPGGEIQGDRVEADGESGPGGILTFTADASPAEVIQFYRARAEAEGLASVMAMNQGTTRAYGAHSISTGANLSVVATPLEEGGASVQLVWSTGG